MIFDECRLRVLLAPADAVFLMKVETARRERDLDDLEMLWPRTSFETPEAAAAAYREAYPTVVEDPHLADWLAKIFRALLVRLSATSAPRSRSFWVHPVSVVSSSSPSTVAGTLIN